METEQVILALAALAQTTRLEAFRQLVRHEPDGVAAGDLARMLSVPQNTLSAHLAVLTRAGLVRGERRSRLIVYRAELSRLSETMQFLSSECCGGRPEACAPLLPPNAACQPTREAAR